MAEETTTATAKATEAPQPEPEFKELSADSKTAIDLAVEEAGVSAVLKHVADGSDDKAMTALKAGNRKGVLLQMRIGQSLGRSAKNILKAEVRAEASTDEDETEAETDDTVAAI
jgi:hypothetical protein